MHIDASHEYEDVMEDVKLWWPKIKPCGMLMGDDYVPPWPGVVRAAHVFTEKNGLELIKRPPKWMVRKPCNHT